MSESTAFNYSNFDKLLEPTGPVMIAGQQLLKVPAISPDDIVFPPSYANPSKKDGDPPVYNIDCLDPNDPSKNVCVLDSIPSQANRMEPLFGTAEYKDLVPQYSVKFPGDIPAVSILKIGHRLADASFRGTTLHPKIVEAFKKYDAGNASLLAKLGPTSLVFGVWDSRSSGVKVPRLINSIIRAFDVQPLKRSAQYSPPIKYKQEGLIPEGLKGKPADHGLADVPSPHEIGGVQIRGVIRRDFTLNLAVLRLLSGKDDDESKKLRRYILGLSLLAFTATPEPTLRQGCQLLPKEKGLTWKRYFANGDEKEWELVSAEDIGEFASAAAKDFGVEQSIDQPLKFDKNYLKKSIDGEAKKKIARNDENPMDNFGKLVNKLKVNKSGTKLNDGPVKKLKEFFDGFAEGDDFKPTVAHVCEVLENEEKPEGKIAKIKDIAFGNESDGDVISERSEDQREVSK